MQLRAVIFDYGMVLSGPPNTSIMAELVRKSCLPATQAEALYRKHRHAYDQGALTGDGYWAQIFAEAGIRKSSQEIHAMALLDARMWTAFDARLQQWQTRLKQSGFKTAILSNMGDVVKESILSAFPHIADFDVLIWSFEHRLLKPDPAIYTLALDKLGVEPAEALFIDDIEENIDAARALGIHGILYRGTDRLANELAKAGCILPLP